MLVDVDVDVDDAVLQFVQLHPKLQNLYRDTW